MKIKFNRSGFSCRFLITISEYNIISIEIFGIGYLRSIIKGHLKPFYQDKRTNGKVGRNSYRKRIEFLQVIKRRWLNLSVRIDRKKVISKYLYRKILKKMQTVRGRTR